MVSVGSLVRSSSFVIGSLSFSSLSWSWWFLPRPNVCPRFNVTPLSLKKGGRGNVIVLARRVVAKKLHQVPLGGRSLVDDMKESKNELERNPMACSTAF